MSDHVVPSLCGWPGVCCLVVDSQAYDQADVDGRPEYDLCRNQDNFSQLVMHVSDRRLLVGVYRNQRNPSSRCFQLLNVIACCIFVHTHMNATIVIVANERVPTDQLNLVIERHRMHKLSPKVAIAYVGELVGELSADVIINLPGPDINLGKGRNLAAKACPADWYMFADADTYYTKELADFTLLGYNVLRGRWRADVDVIDGEPIGVEYHVMAAPMMITHKLFEEIGGYHEGYSNYGHDDSDIDHKLADYGVEVQLINTGARHIVPVHNLLSGDNWDRGRGVNRVLFEERISKSVAERIANDRAVFLS